MCIRDSHPAATILDLIANLPPETLLVLDEAYIDLAPPGTAPVIAPETPNVIRFRTFSKAHGLAGARVGYAIAAAPLAQAFDKVRNHFGMSRISQAGALAALQDQGWLAQVQGRVITARARLNGIAPVSYTHLDVYKRQVMAWVLDQSMILLHPMMPFITEDLWGTTGSRAKLLVHTDWPTYGADLILSLIHI